MTKYRKNNCESCGDTRKRLNTKTMQIEDCPTCKLVKGPVVKREEVKKTGDYSDRVRTGKTQKDKQRKHRSTDNGSS